MHQSIYPITVAPPDVEGHKQYPAADTMGWSSWISSIQSIQYRGWKRSFRTTEQKPESWIKHISINLHRNFHERLLFVIDLLTVWKSLFFFFNNFFEKYWKMTVYGCKTHLQKVLLRQLQFFFVALLFETFDSALSTVWLSQKWYLQFLLSQTKMHCISDYFLA